VAHGGAVAGCRPGGSAPGSLALEKALVPFSSEAQRRYMHMAHPEIAHTWEHGRSSVTGKKESAAQQGKRKRRK
jgi:hypothetical protein